MDFNRGASNWLFVSICTIQATWTLSASWKHFYNNDWELKTVYEIIKKETKSIFTAQLYMTRRSGFFRVRRQISSRQKTIARCLSPFACALSLVMWF